MIKWPQLSFNMCGSSLPERVSISMTPHPLIVAGTNELYSGYNVVNRKLYTQSSNSKYVRHVSLTLLLSIENPYGYPYSNQLLANA